MGGLQAIKAVLFDIDDTLFPSTEFAARARKNACRAMVEAGLHAAPTQAFDTLERIVSRKGSNYGRHFDELCKKFGCKDSDRVIAAGIVAYHNTKASIQPFPEAVRTLLALRDSGYVIAIASEGQKIKQWDKLIRLGLDCLFHDVFVTNEKGAGKTPAFYRTISKKLKIPPSKILMVGNNPKKDIEPAAAAGMKTARMRFGRFAKQKARSDLDLVRLDSLLSSLPGSG